MKKVLMLLAVGLLAVGTTRANSIPWYDIDPNTSGVQAAWWPDGTTVTVYTDDLTGAALANFKIGVSGWTRFLCGISVQYADGNKPAGAQNSIQLSVVDQGGELGSADLTGLPGQMTGGTIYIDPSAVDHAAAMENLGAHEFGHALGLDNAPTAIPRVDAMDPGFDLDSSYAAPTANDINALSAHYRTPDSASVWEFPAVCIALLLLQLRRVPRGGAVFGV